MIFTDAENEAWWRKLSEGERLEILATMVEKMTHSEFAMGLAKQYDRTMSFSPKQLAAIRKWAR